MHHMKRWLIILAAVLMSAGGFYVLFGVIFTNFLWIFGGSNRELRVLLLAAAALQYLVFAGSLCCFS